MKLQELEKERDAYAGKIAKLAIYIALIFALPIALAIGISHWFDFSYVSTFPFAFVLSWTLVVIMYRKIDRKVRDLESRIHALKQSERTEE